MAAATTAIVAVAGLGLTAYGMYDADQKGKDAEAAAKQAKADLLSVQEQNKYKGLQVADLESLDRQDRARMNQTAVMGMQEAGAEAVLGGVPKLTEVDREASLRTAESQAGRIEARDKLIAAEDARIEQSKQNVRRGVYGAEMQGAQTAAAEADIAMAQGTTDLITGAGNLATGLGTATSLEAGAQRNANKNDGTITADGGTGYRGTAGTGDVGFYKGGSVNEPINLTDEQKLKLRREEIERQATGVYRP